MAHIRDQIIAQFLSGISSGVTATVKARGRVYQIPAGSASAVLIYASSETVESLALSRPRTQLRQMTMAVEVIVREPSEATTIDATLDTLIASVEEQIYTTSQLSGSGQFKTMADDIELVSTTITLSGEGDSPIANGRLEYLVTYRVREDAVSTRIPG